MTASTYLAAMDPLQRQRHLQARATIIERIERDRRTAVDRIVREWAERGVDLAKIERENVQ
jgi:hypothetical protein